MKAPDFLEINPMGKVPAIRHSEVIVTEGAAICAYLADAFPETGLAPALGSPARGAIIAGCSSARALSRPR
jgi:glutathione S-transferase